METFGKEDEHKKSLSGRIYTRAGGPCSCRLVLTICTNYQSPCLFVVGTESFVATIMFLTNSVFHTALLTKVMKWNCVRPHAENIFKQYSPATFTPPATYEPYKELLDTELPRVLSSEARVTTTRMPTSWTTRCVSLRRFCCWQLPWYWS
jgi:hypothetical protein